MKKITVSVLLLLSVTTSFVYAQGVGVGIKAGVNFANQSITNISTDSRTGFLGGVYVPIYFSEKWGVVPEVLFSSVGSETPNNVNDFTYLSIPVMLRFKPASFLSFEAGPQFSALLDAVNEDGTSFKEDVKSSDFGLGVGATVSGARVGLVIGKRFCRLATRRNYLKRLIREQFRRVRLDLGAVDLVVRLVRNLPPQFERETRTSLHLDLASLLAKLTQVPRIPS